MSTIYLILFLVYKKNLLYFLQFKKINLIRQSVFETQIDQDTLSTPNL